MSEFYRSQCEEDRWLDQNWAALGLPDVGFFVEFGAGDGVTFSNSLWLEQAKGWQGLLIEADPRNVVKDRTAPVERCAVGPAGKISFCLHPTDSFLSGVRRERGQRIEVESVPLTEILRRREVDRVDLISIDTEGTELEAWRTLDLNRWRPTIAIVELYTWQLPDQSAEIIAGMKADGYKLIHRTEANGIFKSA
jgi:FkbM family methyltransferase